MTAVFLNICMGIIVASTAVIALTVATGAVNVFYQVVFNGRKM